jgi:hypothetical protein
MPQFGLGHTKIAAQPAIPADRFARKIIGILTLFPVRLRRLNGNPLGRPPSLPVVTERRTHDGTIAARAYLVAVSTPPAWLSYLFYHSNILPRKVTR